LVKLVQASSCRKRVFLDWQVWIGANGARSKDNLRKPYRKHRNEVAMGDLAKAGVDFIGAFLV
jgi:hypothetical protein